MSVILAVDPGIRGCGVAIFEKSNLVYAAYVSNPSKEGCHAKEVRAMASLVACSTVIWEPTELALEWPRVYASKIRAGMSTGDPNDLLALAAIDAAIAALLPTAEATCYSPSEWKGQLPKEACLIRVRSRLSDVYNEKAIAELAAAVAKSKAHNMWDAVGIGLFHLGRFERRRSL